jgi:hypothetical protein
MAKKAGKSAAPSMARINVVIDPGTPNFYINHADVGHSPYEFWITLSRLPAKLAPDQIESLKGGGPLNLEAMAQLLIPVSLMPSLISALEKQREVYEAKFGPIKELGKGGVI